MWRPTFPEALCECEPHDAGEDRYASPVSETREERRLVTCVFIDIVGSIDLTVRLGPERLKGALDAAFAEVSARIVAEGGIVEKYIGDAVYALFGAPITHADDPLRALRAAHACRLPLPRERSFVP